MGRALLLAVVIVLLAPGPAQAAAVADADSLWEGPRIVDGGVAWLEYDVARWAVRATRGGEAVTAAKGGVPVEDLETDESDDDISTAGLPGGFAAAGRVATLELLSSGGNTKARQFNTTSDVRRVRLEAGGGAPPLVSCSETADTFGANPAVSAATATDGRTIAVSQCRITKLFDAATGAKLAEFPQLIDKLALAGRSLAYADGPAIVVRDWQAGAEAYRVPVTGSPKALAFDVQDDGALALAVFAQTPKCGGAPLTWHTPAAPAGVVLPAAPCTADVAVDGGRAAVVAEVPGGHVVAEVAPDETRRDLAWLGTGRALAGSLDYRAGTAAYALTRCGGGSTIHLSSGAATPEAVDCVGIRLTLARVSGGRLAVQGVLAVRDTVRLTMTLRAGGRTWRRRVTASSGRFALRLALPARARRRAVRLTVRYGGDAVYRPETTRQTVRPPRSAR